MAERGKHASRAQKQAALREARERAAAEANERAVTRAVTLGTPLVAIVGCAGTWVVVGPAPALLVLAGGALLGAVVFLWTSLRSLAGDAPIDEELDEAVVRERATQAEQEKKQVLRALKDLEHERQVGKIDEADYAALSSQYRARAKAILRSMDAEIEPLRERAEQIARAHLQKKGLVAAGYRDATPPEDDEAGDERAAPRSGASAVAKRTPPGEAREEDVEEDEDDEELADEDDSDGDDVDEDEVDDDDGDEDDDDDAPAPTGLATLSCGKCGTTNDADATFCKKCGAKLARATKDEEDEPASRGAKDREAT